ncbi:MAG: LamG-like jellyroll fold domain-containing protein [Thermoguttaceae bacterium]
MIRLQPRRWAVETVVCLACLAAIVFSDDLAAAATSPGAEQAMRQRLDAPLLFVKRHSYTGIHIYDTFYKWPPGGGGIYVLENPRAPRAQWKIRPVIDPTTPGTLGVGVYTHPDLSYDAKKLLFCFKGEPNGNTSIYEIGIDGHGLRRVTDPAPSCNCYKGAHGGQHDIAPAYLPDGRIVFLSTRPSGLVPCADSGVSILHVMNADGSDIHSISVNHVNEFDPSILPDGRILFGRWEYVDKNALTIQSLWVVRSDGTQETAVFANNMVFPEAILDARAVPGTPLIVGTFAKHNSTPRGSIALVDPRMGKNNPAAIVNLEHPENPTCDTGDSCEPWPVSEDVFLLSGRPAGHKRNLLEMIDRAGRRIVLLSDPDICLHSPMLVKPRPVPAVIGDSIDRHATTGCFFVQDIDRGLSGVKRGEVKHLRVVEETSRVSPTTMGGSPYNQVFLVSAALAFNVKNFLGIVPVDEDGSAYFEAPSGRGVYLQALDADGRIVQSMRTFVQAAPGTTRSCIGCHEYKYASPANERRPNLGDRTPSKLRPESWGSGYVDYPSMVQPILDKHCVGCHGGAEGFAGGMDLSGGWTEHFSISYENLVNRRETQLVAYWISGIDCMNGTALWSSRLFPPRGHGSGAAPLAKLLVGGHEGKIPNLSRTERDLLLAWIDTNGLYHGTWNQTSSGCAIGHWAQTKTALVAEMQGSGCFRCHGSGDRIATVENDWINLKDPQFSRILRAPLAKGADGYGLALCRDRKVDPQRQRIHLLWNGYAHAVQPPEAFTKHATVAYDPSGRPVATFASPQDARYQAMLAIVRGAREKALTNPRVDMPGAEIVAGACRTFVPPPVPEAAPPLSAVQDDDGLVNLRWECSAATIGLGAQVHRSSQAGFLPCERTLLARTTLSQYADNTAPGGRQCYAIVLTSGERVSGPAYALVSVLPPAAPPPPVALKAVPLSYAIRLEWQAPAHPPAGYHVYRGKPGAGKLSKLTPEPVREAVYCDADVKGREPYVYAVRAISRRGLESEPASPVTVSSAIVRDPVFVASFDHEARGTFYGGETLLGTLHGKARCTGGTLDLAQGGHVTFLHRPEFALGQSIAVECWLRLERLGGMPVVLSCGSWHQAGWFLQQLGAVWRWHVGGIDCDGGQPPVGRWVHLVGTYDGRSARLFQDGVGVAERPGAAIAAPWPGEMHVGQYSAQATPDFQVFGQIAGVKIYRRPMVAAEIAAAAKMPPASQSAKSK